PRSPTGPIRLTRCLHGLVDRTRKQLTVWPVVPADQDSRAQRLVLRHGWTVERLTQRKTDLELLCQGCTEGFSGCGDCRVFAVFDEQQAIPRSLWQAHVVLSPSGRVGRGNQMRLRLDDVATFWDRLDQSKPLRREHAEWREARETPNELGPCVLSY